ncbi:uncharacterized protein FRV6_13126 [Fusarium oxysporum]|uniref:Uncharacterized protein n=1 Tax=Fusarium oxysporum TaxID=5507 RepID=A0A2H3TJZ8_FUSOX|nr:uncharacterized protein FRV6_13126 [Fusarium oxysporum]
MSNYCPLV